MIKRVLIFGFILALTITVRAQQVALLQQGKPTSIRGLSVLDDSTAWVSGSKGYIAKTVDGGKTWHWQQVKGFEKADFRSIEAFSAKEAIIMSSGTPAMVLKTSDGGKTWQQKYRNTDTVYFLDAMSFCDTRHGFILGDPIKGKFLLLETKDGGENWKPYINPPTAMHGEAAFAASGTCLRVDSSTITIVTGGSYSRLLFLNYNSSSWITSTTGLIHGKSSQGAFSFAKSISTLVFVGGDYINDKRIDLVASYIASCGYATAINYPATPPAGYQSCVEAIGADEFLSTGTPGTNISLNNGKTWAKIDSTSFNVCRKAVHGKLVLLAGNDGKIAIFNP